MARYIDLDEAIKHLQFDCKAKYPLSYCNGISAAINEIGRLPATDVVPKSEVERLQHILDSYALQYGTVMDKHLVIEKAREEVAREIFEEIEQWLGDYNGCRVITYEKFAELKEKYTGEPK